MKIIGIIPARMGSSRFSGKPLADINGWPMIAHVYKRSKLANILNEVYVATCDKEIYDYIVSIGGKAIMTSDKHERASDRMAEALLYIEKNYKENVDIIVMLQGDEPMITPDMIKAAVNPLINNKKIKISNLYSKINSLEEFEDKNEIKVVIDQNQFALYFSKQTNSI